MVGGELLLSMLTSVHRRPLPLPKLIMCGGNYWRGLLTGSLTDKTKNGSLLVLTK